jgi:hypothetical protein
MMLSRASFDAIFYESNSVLPEEEFSVPSTHDSIGSAVIRVRTNLIWLVSLGSGVVHAGRLHAVWGWRMKDSTSQGLKTKTNRISFEARRKERNSIVFMALRRTNLANLQNRDSNFIFLWNSVLVHWHPTCLSFWSQFLWFVLFACVWAPPSHICLLILIVP